MEAIESRFNNIEWVSPKSLKADPKNPNRHSKAQIERLAKLIDYQGWRWPIIVSRQDGLIKAGHGRLEAARKLKLKLVPVCYQDFKSDEEAYAFMVSDNGISDWAELDLALINSDLGDLGPDFDIELLGLKDFTIEPMDKFEPGTEDDQGKLDQTKIVVMQCPHCGETFEKAQAKIIN